MLASVLVGLLASALIHADAPPDPFAFLSPDIEFSQGDRRRLERGETLVKVLPGHGHYVATVAVTPTSMTPERLIAWSNAVEQLKAGPGVRAIRRLSPNPQPEEFSTLDLPPGDLKDLRNCGPGSCEVKLTADEIAQIRNEIRLAGTDWPARANAAFREIARARILAYQNGGHAALAPYADGRSEPSRAQAFAGLLEESSFLSNLPRLRARLGRPNGEPGDRSFIYWSVEQFGAKDVVSATQTIITRSENPSLPAVTVAGKQIFATHYSVASLNVTALVRRPAGSEPGYYLVVVNRTAVDAIEGMLGGFVRRSIESRVRRDTPDMVATLRDRIEGGPPR